MVNCTWRIIRDANEIDDVMQDILLHVFKRIDDIKRHPNPTALLLRICTQKALDHLRRRKVRAARTGTLPPDIQSATPTPRQAAARAEHQDQLMEFIRRMPPREAEAITLHVLEDMSYPDTAAAMGCTESTARVLVGRARTRFRNAFGRPDEPFDADAPATASPTSPTE